MKFTIPYLIAVFFSHVDGKAEGRIVNGQEGDISKAKYLVRITAAGQVCGGALISKGAVLTAAHCTTTTEASQYDIREGKNTQQEMEQSTKLTTLSVHPHESYSQTTYTADIAVIVVDSSHPLTVFLSLDTSGMAKEGASLHLDGWGLTQAGGSPSSLNQLDHKVVAYSECGDAAESQDSLFCAAAEKQGSTACMGDSGSPLVSGSTVVGVVSHGDANCSKNPTSFTKVSNYVQWVNGKSKSGSSGNNQTSSEPNQNQQPDGSEQPSQNQKPSASEQPNQQPGGSEQPSQQPSGNEQPSQNQKPSASEQPSQQPSGNEQPSQNQKPSASEQPSQQPGGQYQPSNGGQPSQIQQPGNPYQSSNGGQPSGNGQFMNQPFRAFQAIRDP